MYLLLIQKKNYDFWYLSLNKYIKEKKEKLNLLGLVIKISSQPKENSQFAGYNKNK